MNLSRPETARAFEELIGSLDGETQELNKIGSEVAYKGVPDNAAKVMRMAGERARLRDHVQRLYELWQKDSSVELDALTRPPPPPPEPSSAISPPNSKVPGLTISAAAKKLLLTPKQIRTAIQEGQLTAYQRPNGKWKILPLDLITYHRKHVGRS